MNLRHLVWVFIFWSTTSAALAQQVSSLSLINADTGEEIQKLTSGSTLNLALLPPKLGIQATTTPSTVGSVKFVYDSNSNYPFENSAPYCFTGDTNKICNAFSFTVDQHKISATAYSEPKGSGTSGDALLINFEVINKPVAKIETLSLIDMKTKEILASDILKSPEIKVTDLANRCLSIRAEVGSGTIASVVFGLGSNSSFGVENSLPYDLMGDFGPTSRGCLEAGSYSLKITPYSEKKGSGMAGSPVILELNIDDSLVATVESLSLVDMVTNEVIVSNIASSSSIQVPGFFDKCLSVRANMGEGILGSVVFEYEGNEEFAKEGRAPYDLMGDFSNSRGCLPEGEITTIATPYSELNGSGDSGSSLSRTFTIISTEVTTPYVRKNLLIEERFEKTLEEAYRLVNDRPWGLYGDFYRVFRAESKSYAFTISDDVVRSGKSAARFEMKSADKDEGIVRSEIAGLKSETDPDRWYGFSLHLPSSSWSTDSNWDIIAQWNGHADVGELARNPPIDVHISDGRIKITVKWATAEIHTDQTRDGQKTFDLGLVEKDKWLDFVFHIKFSYLEDGVLEVWKNGKKIIDYRGPNSYNDRVLPWFKIGLYKRGWGVPNRVVYGDEVRVGNGDATYKDVAP